MLTLTASSAATLPPLTPVRPIIRCTDRIDHAGCIPECVSMQFQSSVVRSEFKKLSLVAPTGLGKQLLPVDGRKYSNGKRLASIMCSAMNARCSASGQTQTITREAPTITKAPVREPTKTPKLDDGGPGLPPGGDDGGGGGGGGGGGNWSGGFFFFGFLAFLGFLKDKESEEDYRGGRRR